MSTRYGCASQEALAFLDQKYNSMIESTINRIVERTPYPKEYTIGDVNEVISTMSNYTPIQRKRIALRYEDDFIKKFSEVYNQYNIKPLDIRRLNYMISICNKLVVKLKIKFNMPRPYQVAQLFNKCISPISLISTHTPSYPSGHTAAYYLLYLYFTNLDPYREHIYKNIFISAADSRIISGVHFVKDNDMSVKIVKKLKRYLF